MWIITGVIVCVLSRSGSTARNNLNQHEPIAPKAEIIKGTLPLCNK